MKLSELAIFTDDVEDVAEFYERLLGEEPTHSGPGCVLFSHGDAEVLVHETYEPGEGDLPCENHVAFAVDDLDAACKTLQARGLELEVPPRDFDWGRSAYLRDPAGNLVELSAASGDKPTVECRDVEGLPEPALREQLSGLFDRVFDDERLPNLAAHLEGRTTLVNLAADGDRLVGCKIGYEDSPHEFRSWIGGVDPDYRRRGIATELMRRQHTWATQQGYKTVYTKTKNKFREMLILNLRHGFDVIGAYTDRHDDPKLILQKPL